MKDISYIDNFEVTDFHSASNSRQYLLMLGQKHFEISESAYRLICVMKQHKDLDSIAAQYSLLANKPYTERDIAHLIEYLIEPIWNDREKITPSKSFILKRDIISYKSLSKITLLFSGLFKTKYMITLSCISILAIIYTLLHSNIKTFTPDMMYKVPIALLLYFISIIFHELGHVSACRYYKIPHGNIGIAIYIYNPVFYADVTSCWRLKRFERMKVNIGGMYFQLLFCMIVILLAPIIGWDISAYISLFILLSFIINLNPFFKLDGYWIVSDLLGVPNLSKVSFNMLKYAILKLFNRNHEQSRINLSGIPKTNRIILLAYIVISNIFFGFIFLYHLPLLCFSYFGSYIDQSQHFLQILSSWYFDDISISGGEIRSFVFRSLYAILLIIIIVNLLRRFYYSIRDIKESFLLTNQ